MNVNDWMSYECSGEGTYTQNINTGFVVSKTKNIQRL